MHDNKWTVKNSLKSIDIDSLPQYIIQNQAKFKEWIDN